MFSGEIGWHLLKCHANSGLQPSLDRLADPGGASQRDPILSFSHTFPPKSARVGGQRPQREILDPQLRYIIMIILLSQGQIQGDAGGPGPSLATKIEAPAPKFYKIEAPEWQF